MWKTRDLFDNILWVHQQVVRILDTLNNFTTILLQNRFDLCYNFFICLGNTLKFVSFSRYLSHSFYQAWKLCDPKSNKLFKVINEAGEKLLFCPTSRCEVMTSPTSIAGLAVTVSEEVTYYLLLYYYVFVDDLKRLGSMCVYTDFPLIVPQVASDKPITINSLDSLWMAMSESWGCGSCRRWP